MAPPVNKGKTGTCDPVSSSCVIWDGPDIPCIKICKGDAVDVVVAALAKELCNLLTMFNMTTFDLTCLGTCPTPKDIHALIQLLIQKICELENVNPTTPTTPSGCPDCTVNIAPCFNFVNPQGDTVTTMQLVDYVAAIGNEICDLITEITTINQTLGSLAGRVKTLEDNSANAQRQAQQLPVLNPICIADKNVPLGLSEFTQLLEKTFCELQSATGIPNDLLKAVISQCPDLGNSKRLSPAGGNMSSIPGWNNGPQNIAQSFSNMWATICDLRAGVEYVIASCIPDSCAGILLDVSAALSGSVLKLYINGAIPSGFADCLINGTTFTITDTDGHSYSTTFSIGAILNSPTGVQIDLTNSPLNTKLDFTITATACFKKASTNTTCEKFLSYVLVNTLDCPVVTLASPSYTAISYSFNHITGTVTYNVQLYDSTGTTLLSQQTRTMSSAGVVTGTFGGLSGGTVYKVRVQMAAGDKTLNCQFQAMTTQGPPCPAPEDVVATITV